LHTIDKATKETLDAYFNSLISAGCKISHNKLLESFQNSTHISDVSCLIKISGGELLCIGDTDKHARFKHLNYFLNKYIFNNPSKNFTALFVLNDGRPLNIPCFSITRESKKAVYNIPIPMGNDRGIERSCGTPIIGWDDYIDKTIVKKQSLYPWDAKINKAVFRGQLSKKTWKIAKVGVEKSSCWSDTTRGFLYKNFHNDPLFDIGFTKSYEPEIPLSDFMPMSDQQQYKFILNIGNNIDWAERLRILLFMNSVTVIHSAEVLEWFQPLLKPYIHYLPIKEDLSDLHEQISWCIKNDDKCLEIKNQANLFASEYLSENFMYKVFEYMIDKYIEYIYE